MTRNCMNCQYKSPPKGRKSKACKGCDEGMSKWAPRLLSDIRASCRRKEPMPLDGTDAKALERELTRVERELKLTKRKLESDTKDNTEELIGNSEKLVKGFERLLQELSGGIAATTEPLNAKLWEFRARINEYKVRVEATQRTYRLLIAMSQLVDVTDREAVWAKGLVSREQYDAISWEFHRIENLTFGDQLKWRNRHQYSQAIMEIMEDYREATNPRYKD